MARPKGSKNKPKLPEKKAAGKTLTDKTLLKRKAEYEQKLAQLGQELAARENARAEAAQKKEYLEQMSRLSAQQLAQLIESRA